MKLVIHALNRRILKVIVEDSMVVLTYQNETDTFEVMVMVDNLLKVLKVLEVVVVMTNILEMEHGESIQYH